ncbi:flagellar M-ring protein FliF [Alicyclobacillus tolerans]|uniref:flagellar basal-body MS-ring/collar protein FliF n=1 Tax=Alicyclobacillus tolerans TaxID=90970 RepID=UPI001F00BB88|nr:flagellar basal-body MS-ring/collar protein FliF [Alicyclobacillus tolerans]MCF8564751.1 flagellar M-ring protein FliF [Alicyclobacillus tolerans]
MNALNTVNELLRKWWAKLLAGSNRFTPAQKRNLAIAAVAGIACLIVILWVVMRPHYVTIMTGLDNKSLGQVQTELQTLKIPSQISGSSVEVPANQANEARIQLAMANLPQSGYIGYGSIQSSFGMTQDQFNLQVLNVLQESLAQTIESINGVQSAQVHIVMPQQALFVAQNQGSAKASVFLQLASGASLSSAQVNGIQQLVAHSVKGLSSSDVSVVDQNGVTLSGGSSASGLTGFGSSNELQARQQLEAQMTQQLTSGLDQIVGTGNAVVMVHANMTFNQVQTKSHLVQPAQGQTQGLPSSSQQIRRTSNSTSGAGVGGAAGQSSTNPNLPTYSGSSAGNGNSSSSDTESTTNYDNSYTDQTTIGDPVQFNGFTVGVFLNAADKNVTPAVVNEIKSFVTAAVGNQTGASAANNISVSTVPFQTSSLSNPSSSRYNSLLIGGLAVAAAAAAGAGVWWVRRRKKNKVQGQADMESEVDSLLEVVPDISREPSKEAIAKEQIARLAAQKPDEFVNLLRTWLTGD